MSITTVIARPAAVNMTVEGSLIEVFEDRLIVSNRAVCHIDKSGMIDPIDDESAAFLATLSDSEYQEITEWVKSVR